MREGALMKKMIALVLGGSLGMISCTHPMKIEKLLNFFDNTDSCDDEDTIIGETSSFIDRLFGRDQTQKERRRSSQKILFLFQRMLTMENSSSEGLKPLILALNAFEDDRQIGLFENLKQILCEKIEQKVRHRWRRLKKSFRAHINKLQSEDPENKKRINYNRWYRNVRRKKKAFIRKEERGKIKHFLGLLICDRRTSFPVQMYLKSLRESMGFKGIEIN